MITTIIFDMNGVITDDEDCHESATKAAFEEVGLQVTAENYRKFCLGRTDVAAFKDLIEAYQIHSAQSEDLIKAKTKRYLELIKGNVKVYPGVIALLDRLYVNYILALTTSSTFDEAQTVVDQLNLEDKFKIIVSSKDVVHGKPHPEPYRLTAEKLGVKCGECLVIEDSENGVKSAKAAGMKCVAITNTEMSDNLILADEIVNRYSEITDSFIRKM